MFALFAPCQYCEGEGYMPGEILEDCPVCSGKGELRLLDGEFGWTPPPEVRKQVKYKLLRERHHA